MWVDIAMSVCFNINGEIEKERSDITWSDKIANISRSYFAIDISPSIRIRVRPGPTIMYILTLKHRLAEASFRSRYGKGFDKIQHQNIFYSKMYLFIL